MHRAHPRIEAVAIGVSALALVLALGSTVSRSAVGAPAASSPSPSPMAGSSAAALTDQARALIKKGDYKGAVTVATQAIAADPSYGQAYAVRGNAYFDANDAVRAETDLTRALELGDHRAVVYFLRARTYIAQKRYQNAIADATQAVGIDSKDPLAYELRATAYADAGDNARAEADYSAALSLGDTEPIIYYLRASAYMNQHRYNDVIVDMNHAVAGNAKEPAFRVLRGRALYLEGQRAAAFADWTAAIRTANDPDAYDLRGRFYYDQGNYQAAYRDFSRALARAPNYVVTRRLRGSAAYDIDAYKVAIADETTVLHTPGYRDDAFALSYRGVAYFELNQYKQAEQDLRAAVVHAPQDFFALENLGAALYREADYAGARATEQRALAHGSSAYAFAYLGAAEFRLSMPQAIADESAALAAFAKRAHRPYELALKYRGAAFFDAKQYRAAVADETQAIGIDNDPFEYEYRGAARYELHDYAGTIADESVVAKTGGDHFAFVYRAFAYSSLHQYASELPDLDAAIRIGPAEDWLFQERAYVKWQLGDYPGAITDNVTATTINPKNEIAWSNLGGDYDAAHRWRDAVKAEDMAIKLDRNDKISHFNRGIALRHLDRRADALKEFRSAEKIDPKYEIAFYEEGLTLVNVASDVADQVSQMSMEHIAPSGGGVGLVKAASKVALGETETTASGARGAGAAEASGSRHSTEQMKEEYAGAITAYNRAIRLNPSDEDAYLRRGYAHRRLGEYRAALLDYNRAVALNRRDAEAYFLRAWAYDFLGKHQRALDDLRKAVALDSTYASAYHALGVEYLTLGDYHRALAAASRAVQLDPSVGDYFFDRAEAKAQLKDLRGAYIDLWAAHELYRHDKTNKSGADMAANELSILGPQ